MARRGRPPKKQASVASSNKTKKKKPSTKKGKKKYDGVPPSRTWIYAASSDATSFSSEEGYEQYLHQRVQRAVVRSLPGNYSYFQERKGASPEGEDDMYGSEIKEEAPIHPDSLDFTYVPLPLETNTEVVAGAAATAAEKLSSSSAYSEFCTPIIIKDSRLAK